MAARVEVGDRDTLLALLAARGIQVHAPQEPGLERYVRIGIGSRSDMDACERRCWRLRPSLAPVSDQDGCDAYGLALSREELSQPEIRQVEERTRVAARRTVCLPRLPGSRRTRHLRVPTMLQSTDGAAVLDVVEIENRHPATMPTLTAAIAVVSGSRFSRPCWRRALTAMASATYPPVIAAQRVPPSARTTSQSTMIWRSPRAFRSTPARSDRPIRR